jgi:catechol 2,3-dioxygenase-like lactoylglutathione lyase family enzyme
MNMKIFHIYLKTKNIERMKDFYVKTLEMPIIAESKDHFSVQAGKTKITFNRSDETTFYYFALRTENHFDHFLYKLSKENPELLPDENGDLSMFLGGKQVSFYDPDHNVIEMLERKSPYSINTSSWIDVCGIGVPTADINEMMELLKEVPNVNPQEKAEKEVFQFYGDEYGHLVLVKEGGNWYPTQRPSIISPLIIEMSGNTSQTIKHPKLPYTFKIKKVWEHNIPAVQFRFARPTNQFAKIIEFYETGLGLNRIGEFYNHDGYDGVMFGLPNHPYHLEFTTHIEGSPCPAPTKDNLLVFYIPDKDEIIHIVNRLNRLGYYEVEPENPYWRTNGVTIEDPDGWRIVLMNTVGI